MDRSTAQLVPFFESENQRFYSSIGLQFKFCYDIVYLPGTRGRTAQEWRPKVEVIMGTITAQQQQHPPAQYYTSTPQQPVYHPPAQY